MIARPLDLASKLSPPPRSFDCLFYVNVAALALFFLFFGSRFVMAPGLVLGGNAMEIAGAHAGQSRTTCSLRVLSSGQILTDQGLIERSGLKGWLVEQIAAQKAKPNPPTPVLLVLAGPNVTLDELAQIHSMAVAAGFAYSVVAANDVSAALSEH